MNLITTIKAAAIVIFGCGVGWSMAEFDTQQLALEKAPTVSGYQVPPLSSCEAVFRRSDLAKRLGQEFGPVFITPPILCGDELLLVVPPPPAPAPKQRFRLGGVGQRPPTSFARRYQQRYANANTTLAWAQLREGR